MTEAQAYAHAKLAYPEADRINVAKHEYSWMIKVYERYGRDLELLAKYTLPRSQDPA